MELTGIHHLTAITSHVEENLKFYTHRIPDFEQYDAWPALFIMEFYSNLPPMDQGLLLMNLLMC